MSNAQYPMAQARADVRMDSKRTVSLSLRSRWMPNTQRSLFSVHIKEYYFSAQNIAVKTFSLCLQSPLTVSSSFHVAHLHKLQPHGAQAHTHTYDMALLRGSEWVKHFEWLVLLWKWNSSPSSDNKLSSISGKFSWNSGTKPENSIMLRAAASDQQALGLKTFPAQTGF